MADSDTVEQILKEYDGRRSGIVRALTTDPEKLYYECDNDDDDLCLFGLPDGQWEVKKSSVRLLSDLPDPTRGINHARKHIERDNWLSMIALHSDAWLHSLAFFKAANQFQFSDAEREQLFDKINALPTVSEALREYTVKGKQEAKSSHEPTVECSTHKSKLFSKPGKTLSPKKKLNSSPKREDFEFRVCPICGTNYIPKGTLDHCHYG